jgi:nitrate/nitrite-specific signal transduction histidine kinase
LEIMRERAALVSGDLHVSDNVPQGTVVSVRLNGVSSPEPAPRADTLLT